MLRVSLGTLHMRYITTITSRVTTETEKRGSAILRILSNNTRVFGWGWAALVKLLTHSLLSLDQDRGESFSVGQNFWCWKLIKPLKKHVWRNFTDHVNKCILRKLIAFFHLASGPDNLSADEGILRRSQVRRCDWSADTSCGNGNCCSEVLLKFLKLAHLFK